MNENVSFAERNTVMPDMVEMAVHCQLSRGGFSSQRVFRVKTADNQTIAGVADLDYCYAEDTTPLDADQPPEGKRVAGLVAARIVAEEDKDKVLISVPDGKVLAVRRGQLVPRPSKVAPNVPLKS
jgi:hypothetical protein